MKQGSTQSARRSCTRTEEVLVGDRAAAPGVLRPPEHTFQACRLEVSNECPPAPYLRAIQQRSKALSAQGRATRQLKQRARARLTRKRQKTRFAAEFKAAAARTNRSRRWARCAISSVISARRRLQRAALAWGRYFSRHPASGCGALPRAARCLLGPRRRDRNRAKRGSLLSPAHILEEANVHGLDSANHLAH